MALTEKNWKRLRSFLVGDPVPNPEFFDVALAVLDRAFPQGASEKEYRALIEILIEDKFSQRNAADVLSAFTKKDYGLVYNDVLGAGSFGEADLVAGIRLRLVSSGYE